MIVPVILCGGSGSRLWPLSRRDYPKHLIPIFEGLSLYQKTLLRCREVADCAEPMVVTNHTQRFMVSEQTQAIGFASATILLEPMGRNTAAAVAVAAWQWVLKEQQPETLLLVLSADHAITNTEAFTKAVLQAKPWAEQKYLVTFGIEPTCPHTGYGYIALDKGLESTAYPIQKFVEKPDYATACAYIKQGFLWNSGMFLLRADTYLAELKRWAPEIAKATRQAVMAQTKDLDFVRLAAEPFQLSPDVPIDIAVMEKTERGVVIPLDCGWSDVGSWESLAELFPQDLAGNIQQGDVLSIDNENSYLRSEGKFLAALGLKDMIVVSTSDAILVASKTKTQEVKQVVKWLEQANRQEPIHHLTQYRPWGTHRLLAKGPHYEVRQVEVRPGQSIAKQRHQLRAEHWVVLSGIATVVTNEEEVHEVPANESFFAPVGMMHKVKNTGQEKLVFIEVQVGQCLKEDDIERFGEQ